jgi:NitT/TauT family transport system permease protein
MLKKSLSAVALVAAWILIWATAFKISGQEPWKFTPPHWVLQTLWDGIWDGTFVWGILASLLRVAYGFALALLLGISIGLAQAYSRQVNWLIGPLVLGVQTLPSICWLPLAILWFGLNETAILFVVLMGSLGSIAMATRDGLMQVPVTYQRVASTFGASALQKLWFVSVPAALPVFVSGLKQGWSFAWRSLLAGELIFKVVGAGGLLTEARDLADYPRMFAVMILIVLVSILVDRVLFSQLEQAVRMRFGMATR